MWFALLRPLHGFTFPVVDDDPEPSKDSGIVELPVVEVEVEVLGALTSFPHFAAHMALSSVTEVTEAQQLPHYVPFFFENH